MKKAIRMLFTVLLLFSLAACTQSKEVFTVDNSDKSYFVDFYTNEDEVILECVLNIYSSVDGAKVKIYAVDRDNVETGLLTDEILTGKSADGEEIFTLNKGENTVTVNFTGEYGGIYQINSRTLPRFIYITKA